MVNRTSRKRLVISVAALVYGAVLFYWGILLTGFGHGTYVPLGLAASPTILVSLLSERYYYFGVSLFSGPLFWLVLVQVLFWFALVQLLGKATHRRFLLLLLFIHYIGALIVTFWAGDEPRNLIKMARFAPRVFFTGGLVYAAGQIWLWRQIVQLTHSSSGQEKTLRADVLGLKAEWRWLRVFQIANLTSMPMFVWIAEQLRGHDTDSFSKYYWGFVAYAIYAILAGSFRKRLFGARKGVDQDRQAIVRKWKARELIGLSSALTVFACGAFSRMFLETSLWLSVPFYFTGLVLMFIWRPRLPNSIPKWH